MGVGVKKRQNTPQTLGLRKEEGVLQGLLVPCAQVELLGNQITGKGSRGSHSTGYLHAPGDGDSLSKHKVKEDWAKHQA
jgi:hypothetical protein